MVIISVPRDSEHNNLKPDQNRTGSPASDKHKAENAAGKPSRSKRKLYYPTGDGKPMAEDEQHLNLMNYVIPALKYHFRSHPNIYISGNNFVYYEAGNPKARVSPDCYVAFGVERRTHRRFYKVWEERGIAPSVVFEFTSKKTKKEDVTIKKPLYEQVLGVAEYFQFDPTGDYLNPHLQGQRLQDGTYQPIELREDRMTSEQLGLELVIEGENLRFYDPATGETLRTYEEAETQRLAEAQRAADAGRRIAEERQRAETAEAELARLRQELEALRKQG